MAEQPQQNTQPLGEARTNPKSGSQVTVQVDPEPMLFYRPETNEMLVVERSDAGPFLREVRTLDRLMYDSVQAKEKCLEASNNLLSAQRACQGPNRTTPQHPQCLSQAEADYKQANKQLEAAQSKLQDEFKPLGTLDSTGHKLYELIPIKSRSVPDASASTAAQRDGHTWAKKWTYVRSDKIKNHFRSYQLNASEQAAHQSNQKQSILDSEGKIDTGKLREQLTHLVASAKWQQEVLAQGTFTEEINRSIDTSLSEWADGINAGSEYVSLDPEFQLLRYFAGASTQVNWDPQNGNMAVRANARADFSIAEAKFTAACYWPGRAGFMLQLTGPKTGTVHDAGLVRGVLGLELSGTAGASASAQLGVAIDYTDVDAGKVGLRGNPTSKAMSRQAVDIGKEVRDGAELGTDADIFAGARAGGTVRGTFEWNNPEEKKFTALCKIGPGGEVQAGAGASVTFQITFADGKFRFLMAASACLGVGAKGRLSYEVAVEDTWKFSQYVAYMLYSVGYEYTELFTDDAYERLTALSVWAINAGESMAEALEAIGEDLGRVYTELMRDFENETKRIELMNKVLSQPRELEYATPEAKGMILYQLTRHDYDSVAGALSIAANTDPSDIAPSRLEFVGRRKRAVVAVCKKARSKPEFRNIMQHLTADGSNDPRGWESNFEHIKRFLDMRADMQDLDTQVQEYYEDLPVETGEDLVALYERLYEEPIRGYAFVDNTTAQYASRRNYGDHAGFMVAGGFDPGPVAPEFIIPHSVRKQYA